MSSPFVVESNQCLTVVGMSADMNQGVAVRHFIVRGIMEPLPWLHNNETVDTQVESLLDIHIIHLLTMNTKN